MRSYFGKRYGELEEDARIELGLASGQSKPLVARYVAGHLPYEPQNRAWVQFEALAEKILAIGVDAGG